MKVEISGGEVNRVVALEMKFLLNRPIYGLTEEDKCSSNEIQAAAKVIYDFYTS